jgi:hypothetical protein
VTTDDRRAARRLLPLLLIGFTLVALPAAVGVLSISSDPGPTPATTAHSTVTTVLHPLGPDGSAQIWVRVSSPGATTVTFAIGPWSREVPVAEGTSAFGFNPPVDLADPEPPLVVSGSGVRVEVGNGRVPEAVQVNDGWTFRPRSGN